MNNHFKIYPDHLRSSQAEKIDFEVGPEFLDIKEADLKFDEKISIKGEVYLADDQLVLHLGVKTVATLPCLMCNEPVVVPIEVETFYHVEPLADIREGYFDYSTPLREAILLQTPSFAECGGGKCPTREHLSKFLKKPDASTFPFSHLDK